MKMSLIDLVYIVMVVAGAAVLLGSLFLIFRQKIYIDKESGTATEFEFPLIGKFKTNQPALVIIFVGFVMVAYPAVALHKSSCYTPIQIKGKILGSDAAFPVNVYPVSEEREVRKQDPNYILWVPVAGDGSSPIKKIKFFHNDVYLTEKNLEVALQEGSNDAMWNIEVTSLAQSPAPTAVADKPRAESVDVALQRQFQ